MKGKWKVSSNYVGDEKVFQVYRIRNTDEVDHSGNREYYGGIHTDKEKAALMAEKLNKKCCNNCKHSEDYGDSVEYTYCFRRRKKDVRREDVCENWKSEEEFNE